MTSQTQPSAQCGFDPAAYPDAEIPAAIAALAADWRDAIVSAATSPEALTLRPAPDVWAPIEYACHIHDVLAVFAGRVDSMLERDLTEMRWWDHQAAPEATAYLRQDPAIVADTIYAAGCGLATLAGRAEGEDWARTATRRSGEVFTLDDLLRYGLHEMHHHLQDFASA